MSRPGTRILREREVAQLIDLPMSLRVVREAFRAAAQGRVVMPAKLYLPVPHGDFRAMPAFLSRPAACGMKWVNVHPSNPRRGLPSVMAIIVANDPATGFPLAVMDGLFVTKLRTAAASAVAAQVLARRDSGFVGLIGCGAQAELQVLALAEVLPLRVVKVWGHGRQEAARFAARMRRRLERVRFIPMTSIEASVRGVDVVVTLTPSRRPLVKREWLAPGVHINAVGADAPGKQELDPRILRDALVVVDDRPQAIHGGELNVPIRQGQFRAKDIHGTLGEVLVGRRRGRRHPGELTVFDSTGLASHDVALAQEIVARARRRGIGRVVRFFDL